MFRFGNKVALMAFIMAFAMFISSGSFAADDLNSSDGYNMLEICTNASEIAMDVMTARQRDVPLSRMMRAWEKDGRNELYKLMIMDAYEYPNYSSSNNSIRTIDEFGNKWMMLCLRSSD